MKSKESLNSKKLNRYVAHTSHQQQIVFEFYFLSGVLFFQQIQLVTETTRNVSIAARNRSRYPTNELTLEGVNSIK